MSTVQKDWQLHQSCPIATFAKLLPYNHHEFLVVPHTSTTHRNIQPHSDGVYKYNSIVKKWTKIMDYPKDFISTQHMATFDQQNKTIYLLNSMRNRGSLYKINLNSKQIDEISCDIKCNRYPGIAFENGNIHIIGAELDNKHYIFHAKDKVFNEVHDFGPTPILPLDVSLKKRKTLVALPRTGNVSMVAYKNNKWENMTAYFGYFHALSTVCTQHQDFIILINKFANVLTFEMTDNIFIYDLNNNTIKESAIRSPTMKLSTSITTRNVERDSLLTFGFIRDCYRLTAFVAVQKLPFYIIKFIEEWVCFETLHLISIQGEADEHTHWSIDVDTIITSTSE